MSDVRTWVVIIAVQLVICYCIYRMGYKDGEGSKWLKK